MTEHEKVTQADVDSTIATHKGDASAHHAKYTNAEAIAAAKTDTALLNPSGMIIVWHGTIASIPSGWVICDGNSGTPNLLTRFVQGVATGATNPGATGGTATHTLTISQMPSHRHVVTRDGTFYYGRYGSSSSGSAENSAVDGKRECDPAGNSGAHPNEPPFYDVAFIMKT